ncbi:MAG: ABC transporter permease [Anaerolineae bacterium]|nr:ABC transporter permease [Anaerolineae bacterium]
MDTAAKPISIRPTFREMSSRRWETTKDFLKRLWRSPSARLGGLLVILTVSLSIAVPVFDDYDATRDNNLSSKYKSPDCVYQWVAAKFTDTKEDDVSWNNVTCDYPFGADINGRNIFRRVGHGMSVSLRAGVFSVAIALSVGASIGLIAGFIGGILDSVLMRIMDIVLAFPSLLLAIALVSIFREGGLEKGMFAIAVTQIPRYARLARSMSISIRNQEYVTAARSIGTGNTYMLLHHVLPNSLAPLIVQASLGLGTAVIETAALGFLGLGQRPPHPELGKMLAESQVGLASGKWWLMFFPGMSIIMIVLGFNLLGDGMRDVLDPRLKK